MWRIDNPKFQETTLNFNSSGQGFCKVTQLVSGDVVLMDALELMEWDDEKVQVSVCEDCGHVGCQPGGWIVFRSAGDFVLLMQAFEAMLEDDSSKNEYSPPHFLSKKGTAYLARETYETLREQFLSLPPFEKIQPLQMREAMWLVQSSAPLQFLGEPATLHIDHSKLDYVRTLDYVISAVNGQPKEHLRQAENLLRENFENRSVARLSLLSPDDELIRLFIDATQFTDWLVMVRRNGKYYFVLDNEFVVNGGESNNSMDVSAKQLLSKPHISTLFG